MPDNNIHQLGPPLANHGYKLVLIEKAIWNYIGNHRVVALDFETAPNNPYRDDDKAALDPAKAHIVGCSFSVAEGTGIYVPVAHLIGPNIDRAEFFQFLKAFLADRTIIKVVHNRAFETAMSYALGIVIQEPVYDTMCAAQMTLKSPYDFRTLADSGLKHLAAELCGEPLPSFSTVTGGKHFDELDSADTETVRYGAADADFALRLYHIFNGWFDRYMPQHRRIVEEIESPTAAYLGYHAVQRHPHRPPAHERAQSRGRGQDSAHPPTDHSHHRQCQHRH